MRLKFLLTASLAILVSHSVPNAIAAASAADKAPGENSSESSSQPSQLPNSPQTPGADLGLRVDDINDLGYALQRIRQQAINIYIEALRKPDSLAVTADLSPMTRVPAELPKDTSNLLPFRRPWLVYFITTLEPLVHLLKEDVKQFDQGSREIDVLPETRKAIEPLIQEWAIGVKNLDQELVAATALIDDADKNNIELAKIASSLDHDVSKMEKLRDRCFAIVAKMEHRSTLHLENAKK